MKRILFTTFILSVLLQGATAQDPTVWRNGTDGIYPGTGLLKSWPADGPEILWVFEGLGEGHSSPVFAHEHIFLATMIDNVGYVVIFDMDGNEVKRYSYGPEYHDSFNGSRSSTVIVGDWLYIYSGYGVISAFEAMTGELRWKRDMLKETDGENIQWGVTETLVVDGDKIFCSPGGKTQNVVALNRKTGEQIWASPGLGEPSAYCTPLLLDLGSRKLLVTMMNSHILGIDSETGETLWNYHQPNQWSVHANTPVYRDGVLFCTSGYGHGTVALNLAPDGSSVTKKWFNSDFDNRMGGVVYLDGYLYASGDKNRGWMAVNAESGETVWSVRNPANGVVISADGLLYLYTDRGELVLVEPTPEEYRQISETRVTHGTAQHWAHPVIHNGNLYLRHGDALIAYKIK
jgi:outer membrane protein assembly factor BamB